MSVITRMKKNQISRFYIIVFSVILVCIDCDSTSTESPITTLTDSFISTEYNPSTPSWLAEALKDIAYYLRAHKFNEYDRRYEPDPKLAKKEYFKEFPRPPLRSLHWEVHKYCEESLSECINYLRKRIKHAGMKRVDDTVVVIHEQQWNLNNNSKQIEIVDNDCKKLRKADDIQANPFEGPLERFQWRVTASYYLCWYTMKSDPLLEHLFDSCDNFANCLDPNTGPNNEDVRARDENPFACALYSFCPDPCCPIKHLTRPENCWNMFDNPCFAANPEGHRQCVVDRAQNTDFRDIILNRWNVSCSCPKNGYEWSSFYGLCIDIDECALGTHTCDPENEICLNLPGSFQCVCKWGHVHDSINKKCKPSDALVHLILQKHEDNEAETKISFWTRFIRWFEEKSTSERLQQNNYIIALSILFAFLIKFN